MADTNMIAHLYYAPTERVTPQVPETGPTVEPDVVGITKETVFK